MYLREKRSADTPLTKEDVQNSLKNPDSLIYKRDLDEQIELALEQAVQLIKLDRLAFAQVEERKKGNEEKKLEKREIEEEQQQQLYNEQANKTSETPPDTSVAGMLIDEIALEAKLKEQLAVIDDRIDTSIDTWHKEQEEMAGKYVDTLLSSLQNEDPLKTQLTDMKSEIKTIVESGASPVEILSHVPSLTEAINSGEKSQEVVANEIAQKQTIGTELGLLFQLKLMKPSEIRAFNLENKDKLGLSKLQKDRTENILGKLPDAIADVNAKSEVTEKLTNVENQIAQKKELLNPSKKAEQQDSTSSHLRTPFKTKLEPPGASK